MNENWESVFLEEVHLGEILRHAELQIFFGGVHSTHENLRKAFPEYQWTRAKQVHGNHLLHAQTAVAEWTNPPSEADGIITSAKNLAAAILTADCLPVMVWDEKRKVVSSVHAGWKGIANRILPECAKKLLHAGSSPNDLSWWIGPHIQEQSFEVGQDVADQLVQSAQDGKKSLRPHPTPGKTKINLSVLAIQQIYEFGEPKYVWVSPVDTVTDPRHASYRRDSRSAAATTRQMSFIVRN